MNVDHHNPRGLQVVEFASAGHGIASAYAAWLLARLGASVQRWITADVALDSGDLIAVAIDTLAEAKAEHAAPDTRAEFDERLKNVDILIADTPDTLIDLAGSLQDIRKRLPNLILAVGSTFGLDGPYARFNGNGLDAQALSGVAWALGEPTRAPLSFPPGIVEHQTGVNLAAGALLALHARDERGNGGIVDVALADTLASYVGGNCRLYIHHGLRWHRSGRRASGSGGAYPYVVLPCKDGEVCVFGRTPEEWSRLIGVMGDPAWASEPRYQDLRALGQQYPEEGDRRIMPWLAQHTKAELEAIALQNNLILSPVRNFADVLATSQFREREFFDTTVLKHRTITLPGLPFRITEARDPEARNIAPDLLGLRPGELATTGSGKAALPLTGLRVLDFGWVWSAPWVSGILAELGAEVIKVEHGKRPDNLRLSGRVIRDGKKIEGPSKEMSPMFHQVNHGKLGISLNVKEPRAVELLKQLAEISDIVIENMSPGTMERSGLGYDTLKAINPKIVMLAMSAAGQFGSLANMRAYAPNMSCAAGLESLVGYTDESPIGALNVALGDPNASAHALTAVLAAWYRAKHSGRGCYIDVSQIEALLSTLRPYVIDAQVSDRQPPTLGNAHPTLAPHGIYPALGDDDWLCLSVNNDREWDSLAKLAGNSAWANDARYATNAGRFAHAKELDAHLAAWTSKRPRDELVDTLRRAGLASSAVLSVEEQWSDPHFAARDMKHRVEIPVYGEEPLFRAPWRFSDFSPIIDNCGPALGQHNEQVLGDLLGLSKNEIDELRASGVVA